MSDWTGAEFVKLSEEQFEQLERDEKIAYIRQLRFEEKLARYFEDAKENSIALRNSQYRHLNHKHKNN